LTRAVFNSMRVYDPAMPVIVKAPTTAAATKTPT
jgi:hypothetical protein